MFHTVFFDIGGTLVTGESSLKYIAREMDPDREQELFRYMVDEFMKIYLNLDIPRFYSIKELLALTGKMASEKYGLPDISHRAVELYRKNHMENDFLYDDTIPTLNKLKENNVKIIMISDADADVLLEQMKKFDILHFFDATIISNQVRAYKPSDKTVSYARQYCSEPLDEILLVGDKPMDMKTAKKLGIKSALINRNGKFKYEADFHISGLAEIFNLQSDD
jgi:2-haloalkanoic acid dehalogenase type II